jgi:hypothetical protein
VGERYSVERTLRDFAVFANALALVAALGAGIRWRNKDRANTEDKR